MTAVPTIRDCQFRPLCESSETGVLRARYAALSETVVVRQHLEMAGFSGVTVLSYGHTGDIPDVWVESLRDGVYQVRFPRFKGRVCVDAKIIGDDLKAIIGSKE